MAHGRDVSVKSVAKDFTVGMIMSNKSNLDSAEGIAKKSNVSNSSDVSETLNEASSVVRKKGGRLGKEETRLQNKEIGEYLESEGYTITGGAGKYKEEYLPGPDGKRKGSNYVDITAEKDGEIIRINTVDTYKDGTPTKRELKAAQSINSKTPKDKNIILIPKGTGLHNLKEQL